MDRNIEKYRAFVAAADCGNVTRAAASLSVSQSTVSKMISDLEKEWDLTLMLRNRYGVKLTPDGELLLPYVRHLLEDCEKLEEKVTDIRGLSSGIIRIGTFQSIAEHWMPKIIRSFHADYPNIRYELLMGDYDEIENWIEQGRVDCGFLRLPTRPEFDTLFLTDDTYRVVLPKDHPLGRKSAIDPQDLNGLPFLLLEHGGRTEVSELLERYHITPDVHFTTWDDYAIMAMVESGQGVAILPQLILQRIPYDILIRPLSVPAKSRIVLAMKNRKTITKAMPKFLEYLPVREKED